MVSSKCFQVESPSPFKFLAALMPPWAHTECERFTGTIENRSTSPPISAILMTAAKPASPPPTTIILGFAILLHRPSVGGCGSGMCLIRVDDRRTCGRSVLEPRPERVQAHQAHGAHKNKQCQACGEESFLRLIARDDSPFRREQPYAIGEVPRGADQSDDIESEQERILYFCLHFAERGHGIVVQVRAGKPHGIGVPDDVKERDATRPALRCVHPIAGPRIIANVAVSAIPDVEAVESVKQDRQPNTEQFQEENQRKIREKTNLAGVGCGTGDRRRDRDQNMFEEEAADRNNSRKRVEPPQNK